MVNGLLVTNLSNLTPTINNVTASLISGTRTDFLAPQTYTLTISGVTEDYKVQVQPKNKSELMNIVNEAIKTTNKGSTASLNFIDTYKITDMSQLFYINKTFNGDISEWDVSSVRNRSWMFNGAKKFNSDLSKWKMSSVRIMIGMFWNSKVFTSDLSS